MISIWLDDMDSDMRPIPEGWVHVKTVDEAIKILSTQPVYQMSLDHDLGACAECLEATKDWKGVMPNCPHFGTGYDLCMWMADKGIWPQLKPTVHSLNTVGKPRMMGVIDRYFPDHE